MINQLLLKALHCKNEDRPPVWLMRQAGRYMPEYRTLREKHSLWSLFHTPELAAQVTLQPVDLLGVDAAILFSDILVIAEVFGLEVVFPEGSAPQIVPKVENTLEARNVEETLFYVRETIQLVKPQLKCPLIGFCGGPFTLATYMTGKSASRLTQDKELLHTILQKITDVLIRYLMMQIKAGVDAVQVFDSWANLLSPVDFMEFSHAYLGKIVEALKPTGVPIILFCRSSSHYPRELSLLSPHAISFDWHKDMYALRKEVPANIAVQGNIDPEFLQGATSSQVSAKVKELLQTMKGEPGFIVNLGHGVLPKTPVENVRAFIDCVKLFSF